MGHYYYFSRGDAVTITSGRYKGHTAVVDSAVFQRTVDYPDEHAWGYHLVLDTGPWVTVRWDEVSASSECPKATQVCPQDAGTH